jgi:hypothetical protein
MKTLTLGIGAGAFLIYAATLYPSVPGGDAGELIAAAAATGVPHPPGYPLFVLWTKLFTWLPIFNVAWRSNLATAVAAALAAALLARAVAQASGQTSAGAAAAGVFALSPAVWLYAISAEVFALNNLIIALELALMVAVMRTGRRILVYAAALVFGLGLSNHHTSLFINGVLLAAMLWHMRERSLRHWGIVAGAVALGGLPYLYLVVAPLGDPVVTWGETNTWAGFFAHVLRREYGTFSLSPLQLETAPTFGEQWQAYAADLVKQVTWIGVALGAWGLWRGLSNRKTRPLCAPMLAAWAAYLGVFHALAQLPVDDPLYHGVVARFWLAPNLLVCAWIGFGVAALPVPAPVVAAIAAVLAGAQAGLHVRSLNHRNDVVVRDYGAAILQSLPPNALVVGRGDLITSPARYLHYIERMRPDLRVLDQELLTSRWMTRHVRRTMPDVTLPGTHYAKGDPAGYMLRQLTEANLAARPVVLCGGVKPGDDSLTGVFQLVSIGICDLVLPAGADPRVTADGWLARERAWRAAFSNDMRRKSAPGSWESVAKQSYWLSLDRLALAQLTAGIERRDDPALLRGAAEAFTRLRDEYPERPPHILKNLGLAWSRLAPSDPLAGARAAEAWQMYLKEGPATDPERPAIEQAVRDFGAVKR